MTRTTASRVLSFVVAAALAMIGTACSDPGEKVTTTGSPGGRDDLLFVSIEVGGGFVPQGHDFRQPPRAVVYSDGSAFAPGAITLQYPGPAILPVYRTEVTQPELEEILTAAENAGLTKDKRDYGNPPVADAPSTTITVVVDGQTYVTSINALGIDSPPGPEGEPDNAPVGVSEEERAARKRAQKFVELVTSMTTAGESSDYEPQRYRALPLAVDPNAPSPEAEMGVEPQVKDWPFPDITLVSNECVGIGGQDAPTFRDALRDANEITRWRTQSGELYNVAVRPVLPHEPDCPEEQKAGEPGPESP